MRFRSLLRPRTCLLGLPVLLALLCAGYAAWWNLVAERLEAALPGIVERMAEDGIAFDAGSHRVEGFPYRIELAMDAPSLAGAGWGWRPERIQLFLQPWNLSHAVVLAGGGHAFSLGDGGPEWVVERMRASVRLTSSGEPGRVSVEAHGLSRKGPGPSLSLEDAEVHVRWRDGGMDLAMMLRDAAFEGSPLSVLDDLVLEGRAAPPEGLSDLRAWAVAGGVLEVDRLHLVRGGFEGEADGTITLDAAGRPLGAFTVSMTAHREVLGDLVDAGEIAPPAALALEVALALLSDSERREDGARVVRAPLTLQDGFLSVAGIPLLPLPAVLGPAESR